MTPQELTALVERQDEAGLVEALSGLPEPDRRALAATALELRKAALEARGRAIDVWQRAAHAQLAVMGTASRQEIRKCNFEEHDSSMIEHFKLDASLGRILVDRHPDWLREFVESTYLPWETVLPVIQAGCVSPVTSDLVLREMFVGLYERGGIVDTLIGEPEMLEGVYRAFEIDMDALGYLGERRERDADWGPAIIELCNRGHLDRTRMLGKIVEGLANDHLPETIGRMLRFHDALVATADERKALEAEYLALLASAQTSFIGFALRHLKALAKAKQLDADAYVREVPRVFHCPAKSHPKTALALLKTAVKQQPGLRSAAVLAAAEGLAHPHEDVQDAAMKLVETWAEPGDFQLSETLASHRDQVAAPIRPRVDAVVGKLAGAAEGESESVSTTGPDAATPGSDWAGDLDARRAEIDRLPKPVRQKLGLDEVLAACEQGRLAAPTTWTPLDAPVLASLERIEPIQSLDELFDVVAHAIETVDHGDDVERILDGISRMCDRRPDGFQRRAAPIVARIEKCLQATTSGLMTWVCDRGVAPVLMAWLTGSLKAEGMSSGIALIWRGCTWRQSMAYRMRKLAARVKNRVAAPLLAAPSHRGGWIDPSVWAERWECLTRARVEVPEIELIQSLLRLTPEGREAALERIKPIECLFHDPVVWALGGEADIGARPRSAAVWIAAGRCRDPNGHLSNEPWPGTKLTGPDVWEPACCRWRSVKGRYRFEASEEWFERVFDPDGDDPILQFDLQPPLDWDVSRSLLSARSHFSEVSFAAILPQWVIQWSAMVWPAKLDGYWRFAARAFLFRLDKRSSALSPFAAYLDPLFEPDRPLTELAALALWVATLGKDADSRTAAIDAWIALVGDGRGDAGLLGDVLTRLAEGGWLRLNRLADALREVSRASSLHAWTVAEVLQDLLASLEALPRDAHHVLQLLRELLVQLGLEARPELRASLQSQKGTGKTAKLARQLAKLAPTESAEARTAALELLDARIARANRWSKGG